MENEIRKRRLIFVFEKLFSPIKIKDMELKNRIILPAIRTQFSGDESEFTLRLLDHIGIRVSKW